jgi:hypothetical protein
MGEPWKIVPNETDNVYLEDGLKMVLPTGYTLSLVPSMAWTKVIRKVFKKNKKSSA